MRSLSLPLRLLLTCAIGLGLGTGSLMAADTPAAPSAETPAKPIPYPLDHCIVSGDPLKNDAMGKPISTIYKGQEVIFCCKDCVNDFNKDPDSYMAKIQAAKAKKDAATATTPDAPAPAQK